MFVILIKKKIKGMRLNFEENYFFELLLTRFYFFSVFSVESPTITIPKVSRHHMGAYLCIASNGVPPTVSKRVMVIVNCNAKKKEF